MDTNILIGALNCANANYRIFPCAPGAKNPLINGWPKKAADDVETIRNWWAQWPNANIGLPTGIENDLFVLDIDCKGDVDGFASLAELESQFSKLPDTRRVDTPSGGAHLYFRYPTDITVKNKVGFRPGLDIRGDGGYVVAPPSTIDGVPYRPVGDAEPEIADAPEWLLDVLSADVSSTTRRAGSSDMSGSPQGTRNSTVFSYAASLVSRGVRNDEAELLVLEKARSCEPPLPAKEAIGCLKSAYGRYSYSRPLTDFGNAERLVDRYGSNIRHVPSLARWYTSSDHLWLNAELGEIQRLAKSTIRAISDEARREKDTNKAQFLLKHAKRSESSNAVANMLSLAASEPGISISPGALDKNDFLFGVQNGVLCLKSGRLIEDPLREFVTMAGDVSYDPSATCPNWLRFLAASTGGDEELQDFLQRCVGYSMIGGNPQQIVAVLHGSGANGKSTFLRTVQRLFGTYAKAVENSLFMVQRFQSGGGPREDILRLRAARLALSTELGEGQVVNEELVKRMTGDDVLAARAPYAKSTVEFVPKFTPWIATNHKPIIKNDDHAIWRRIMLVPFTETIPAEKQDRFLGGKLAKELPGILNWALAGCIAWQEKNDLKIPESVLAATREYRSEMDLLEEWIDTSCEIGPNVQSTTSDLYGSYKYWCVAHNETFPVSKIVFGRKISGKGFQRTKINQMRGFKGIQPKPARGPVERVMRDIVTTSRSSEVT